MIFTTKAVAATCAACLTTISSGAIYSFNSQTLFNNYAIKHAANVYTENFDSYSGAPLTFTGTLGMVNWTASTVGNLHAASGIMSTQSASVPLYFDFSPGVNGVGGNFFATLSDITQTVPCTVLVGLSDGSGFIGHIDNSNQFTGFWSTGAAIHSISIQVEDGPVGVAVYASAGSLSIASVPAPGAAALIGVAGIIASRRRRS